MLTRHQFPLKEVHSNYIVVKFPECFTFFWGHILSTTGDALTLVQDWYYLGPLRLFGVGEG